ncbi:MAG: signal peptide peptidase SppA [Candidatus Woesearchaeota archaeon]
MSKISSMLGTLVIFLIAALLISSYFKMEGFDVGKKIPVVEIKGLITYDGSSSFLMQATSSKEIIKQLGKYEADESVKGVILEINSNGGTVVASKSLADAVSRMQKPVVAVVGESAASGAYWVAAASDAIVADELSMVGSVGVLGSYLQFSGLMDKYGVEYERVVAGKYKDVGSPFKELTDDEEKMLQGKVDMIQDTFSEEIANYRHLNYGVKERIATGEFFLGKEAISLGLVDELGGMGNALNITRGLANDTDAQLYFKPEPSRFFDKLLGFSSQASYYFGRGFGREFLASGENGLEIRA